MTTSEMKTSEMKSDLRVRNACMTLNNYTEEQFSYICDKGKDMPYLIVAKEVGDSGTPHLQMYCEFKLQKTYSAIKKYFNAPTIHIEARRGTAKQASDYCRYADYNKETHSGTILNDFVEFGTLTSQGKRNDIVEAITSMRNDNKTPLEILEETPHLLPYYRMLKEVKRDMITLKHRDLKVIVLYGGAGTGKSRYAYETYPDLYSKPAGDWWDGYEGETTILLDDFYGGIQYATLLNVLDRYKLRVPIKGGFVNANWDTVIITSNKHPNEWYNKGLTPALKRRIHECYKLEGEEGISTQWYTDDLDGNVVYHHTINYKEITPKNIEITPVGEALPFLDANLPASSPNLPLVVSEPPITSIIPIINTPQVKQKIQIPKLVERLCKRCVPSDTPINIAYIGYHCDNCSKLITRKSRLIPLSKHEKHYEYDSPPSPYEYNTSLSADLPASDNPYDVSCF